MPTSHETLFIDAILSEVKTSHKPSKWSAQILVGNCYTCVQMDTVADCNGLKINDWHITHRKNPELRSRTVPASTEFHANNGTSVCLK